MKNIILIIFLLIGVTSVAQNYTINQPVMRVNRSASLTLSTSWQTVDFNGTSTENKNTYGLDPVSGNRFVWWDSTNKLFKIIGDYDKNLSLQLYLATTTTGITTRSKLQYRIVIPNGVSPGVDKYLPAPELGGGYADIGEVTLDLLNTNHPSASGTLTADSNVRTNGFYIQVRLTAAITLGSSSLTGAVFLIQSNY